MNKSFIKYNLVELVWCSLIFVLNLKDEDFWYLVPVFCTLTLLILRPTQLLGIMVSVIFMLAGIFFSFAWISELKEFHTFNQAASALLAGGGGILILLLGSALMLFKKYFRSDFVHTRMQWK